MRKPAKCQVEVYSSYITGRVKPSLDFLSAIRSRAGVRVTAAGTGCLLAGAGGSGHKPVDGLTGKRPKVSVRLVWAGSLGTLQFLPGLVVQEWAGIAGRGWAFPAHEAGR